MDGGCNARQTQGGGTRKGPDFESRSPSLPRRVGRRDHQPLPAPKSQHQMHASICIAIEDSQRAPGACASEPPHSERGPATPDARETLLPLLKSPTLRTPPRPKMWAISLATLGFSATFSTVTVCMGPAPSPGGNQSGSRRGQRWLGLLPPSQFSAPPVFHTPVRRFFRVLAGASQNPKPNPPPKNHDRF